MVLTPRLPAVAHVVFQPHVVGRILGTVLTYLVICSPTAGATPKVHYRHSGDMPPGAIGRWQLQRGGPLPGYFQPVEIKAPDGAMVSLAIAETCEPGRSTPRTAGMLIGQVYRMRVTHIPLRPGIEVFPTIELIDRIYPPPGLELKCPIPVELTQEDLILAARGKFVTRVIYLEDPDRALPTAQVAGSQHWIDAGIGNDPLRVADTLGRPVAILRMGARLPDNMGANGKFFFGSPPWQDYLQPAVESDEFPEQPAAPAGPMAPDMLPDQPATPMIEERQTLRRSINQRDSIWR